MLACAQLGITVCSLGLGAVAEPAVAHLLEVPFDGGPRCRRSCSTRSRSSIALAIVVYLHVVVGEMVPKNLAIAGPERAALRARAAAGRRRPGGRARSSSCWTPPPTRAPAADARGAQGRAGVRVHGRGGRTRSSPSRAARDCSTRRSTGCSPARSSSRRARPSRSWCPPSGSSRPLPAPPPRRSSGSSPAPGSAGCRCRPEATGGSSGYLHVKDLLYADDGAYTDPVPPRRVRALVTVPVQEDVEEALVAMQRAGSHLARVVEPDGRTVGVLFLEDVLEELVGEVRDATQRPARAPRPVAQHSLDGALTPPQRRV